MNDTTIKYYAGNRMYNNDKLLDYLLFDEGLVTKSSGGYSYVYHLKDHPSEDGQVPGNTRVSFQPNGTGGTTTTQVAEYYPFGSSYLPVSPAGTNKYLYNGKLKRSVNPDLSGEKQDDVLDGTALDLYDYGARFYDPVIGRWHTIDPHANSYRFISPYSYVNNNPVSSIDPDGRDIIVLNATKAVALGIGHGAVLIGNPSKGYKYYSKNGTTKHYGI
jgi:RHS repeat-associated protein